MNRTTVVLVVAALVGGLVGGLLLAGQQGVAFAQGNDTETSKPPDTATALLAPNPVVAAVPYLSKTDYEQDPFEPTKLRRTTTLVQRVMLVRQDGTLEVKQSPE